MSRSKLDTGAQLPAPLSLTLDEVRNVAGGGSMVAVNAIAHWWWYGQPAPNWVMTQQAVSQQAVSPQAGVQLGAVQSFGG